MRLSATFADGTTRLRALLDHPMESGQRTDSRGTAIDADFLRKVSVTLGDRQLLSTDIGANLSKNPYFSIEFEGAAPEDEVTIEWENDKGETNTYTVKVEAAGE